MHCFGWTNINVKLENFLPLSTTSKCLKKSQNISQLYCVLSGKNKMKIIPSVDNGCILLRILVTCLHLKRTKNDIHEGHLSGIIGFRKCTDHPDYTREMVFMYIIIGLKTLVYKILFKFQNYYLCFSNFKHLIISVDDGCGRSTAADETDSLCVSGEFHGALSGHGIRWVEHCRCRDGAEHRKIFKSHLRRTVLSCTQQNDLGVKNKIQMVMYP